MQVHTEHSAGTFAVSKPERRASLPTLAREALKDAGGDVAVAVEALIRTLTSDPAMLRSVVTEAVRTAVEVHVAASMRHDRKTITQSVRTGATRQSIEALASGMAVAMLNFPLANGLRLRDATLDDVTKQADRYEAFAADNSHKARWLRRIAAELPSGAKVGEVMTEERVRALYLETSNG
jgi:hypothetical protein